MPSLYNYSPLASMLLGSVLLALLPLAWVWYRNRTATPLGRVQALALLTLFLTFDLLLFGAFTRLTDSGLGCPDWPGCYGNASPIGAHSAIAEAQGAMPTGPVTHGKAWVEMIHRYVASGVGFLILLLALAPWLGRSERARNWQSHRASLWGPALTLLWVCLQGAFGAWTVTMKLFPAIVTLHLLGGLVLLVLLCLQTIGYWQAEGGVARLAVAPGLRWLLGLSFAAVVLQSALGAWVSTNYAVLACPDFPTCQGSWWPRMDFVHGFEIWRGLGLTGAGDPIDFSALTAIHYVHRAAALAVFLLLAALAWQLNRVPGLRSQSRWIAALTGLQLATGISNVVFDWPLLAALLHTGGSGALVIVLTMALAGSRRAGDVKRITPVRAGTGTRVSA